MINRIEEVQYEKTFIDDNVYAVEIVKYNFHPKTFFLILVLCAILMFDTCGIAIGRGDTWMFIGAYISMMVDFCIAFSFIEDIKEEIAENFIKNHI